MSENPNIPDSDCGCPDAGRRKFLKHSAALTGVAFLAGAVEGCASAEPEMRVGTLQELKARGFLSPKFNGDRIFVTYRNEELTTFSLICRHKKCTVKWKAGNQRFECPCHDSMYNADGKVLSGPPPGPLHRFKTELRGEEIWVLNEFME